MGQMIRIVMNMWHTMAIFFYFKIKRRLFCILIVLVQSDWKPPLQSTLGHHSMTIELTEWWNFILWIAVRDNLVIFQEVCQHDNDRDPLLPDHCPVIRHRILLWTYCIIRYIYKYMYIFLNFRDRNSEEVLLQTQPPSPQMIKSQNKSLNV